MKRFLMVLVAGTVLVGAGAPMATAADELPVKEAPVEQQATLQDWLEFGQELRQIRRTLRAAEAMLSVEEWRYDECRFQSLQEGTWTSLEEQLTSECALAKWSVSGGYVRFYAVADCESGWNRFASNSGRYLGLFQHSATYWGGRVRAYEPPAWDKGLSSRWQNSRTQVVVTARMVHGGGWGPWSCA